MDPRVKSIVENLKVPMLMCTLQIKDKSLPNLLSHIGGTPYSEENDRLPVCRACKSPMQFVFQVHSHKKEQDSTLYCFYYCFGCNMEKGNKGFHLRSFENPTLDKLVKQPNRKPALPYAEFNWNVHWSLPEWDSLPFIDEKVQKILFETSGEDAEMDYDQAIEDLLFYDDQHDIHTHANILPGYVDTFSFFGGYPKFLGFPFYPTCACCDQHMELFMQLDSSNAHKLIWREEGCLYVFRCTRNANQFSILIQ